MNFVDTHCHIQSAGLREGERTTRELWAKNPSLSPAQIIQNASQAGVTKLICVGCDLQDSQLAVSFVQAHEACWASIGIHPHEAQQYAGDSQKQAAFAALASEPKVVAIGECGLDYFYEHSPKTAQKELLAFQLSLAKRHNLPLIFHVREAFDDFWPIFDQFTGLKGVLHSYTDSAENLQQALDRGLYIGINGIATFAKDGVQQAVYNSIPLKNLLLETDAPFLTPTPYRGTINEPKYVARVAEFVAGARGESLATLSAQTTRNAETLFGI